VNVDPLHIEQEPLAYYWKSLAPASTQLCCEQLQLHKTSAWSVNCDTELLEEVAPFICSDNQSGRAEKPVKSSETAVLEHLRDIAETGGN
jgi:hypothetical protein